MIRKLPLRREAALSRGDVTDAEWVIINPLLPDRGERGPAVTNKRRRVNGILWVRRAMARHAQALRQLELGVRALHPLEQTRGLGRGLRDIGFSWAARRHGTCHRFNDRPGAPTCRRRKRGNQEEQALGRSRGGFSTKIHLRTNAKGDPLAFEVTGGEAHEVKGYGALMGLHDTNPSRLLGDKGYDSDEIRDDLATRGIAPVIPPRSNRKTPVEYDRDAYKRRNLIERCVNRLKQFRRIATRYEKTARAYLSMLCLAAARLWIKTVNRA
jgi:transposase